MPLERIEIDESNLRDALGAISARTTSAPAEVEVRVREIIASVSQRGDAAVEQWTAEIEGRSPGENGSYEIPREVLDRAAAGMDAPLAMALETAAQRIADFHRHQLDTGYWTAEGELGLRVAALARVGLYVPGGTASYPSSVLMTAIPAKLAGVGEIVMVTPGATPETLAAAVLAGVDRVFELGGAQAIAALAYGTETVPRVDKIVGPGNRWVATAKRLVFGDVDIDSVAGPSEILIIADDSVDPSWVAADLIAQAEHDVEARALLLSPSSALIAAVSAAVATQLESLPRRDIARESLRRHGLAVHCSSLDVAVKFANRYAPEHLEVLTEDADAVAEGLHTAGALFVGGYSPEAAGDYLAGPNHVLPTGGSARFASPLGVYDFVKRTSVIRQTSAQLGGQAAAISLLARAESLEGHARSVELRVSAHGESEKEGLNSSDSLTSPAEASSLSSPVLRWVPPALLDMSAYEVEIPPGIDHALHANEMRVPFPPAIEADLARAASAADLRRYPDPGGGELKAALAAWLSDGSHSVEATRLVLGNGSDELISLLCGLFRRPPAGARCASVLYPVPTFSIFRFAAQIVGLAVAEVPLANDFHLDRSAMEEALARHRPNLVFLARPNNPTGTLWSRHDILELAEAHPSSLFVVDEAYIHYGGDSLLDAVGGNLAVMGTLSKVGMAAARIGYLYASADVSSVLESCRLPFNIGGLNQSVARVLLDNHKDWIAERCMDLKAERERMAAALAALAEVHVYESAANFLLLRVGDLGRGHDLWQRLAKAGVLVRDLDSPGPLAGCIRVTVGQRAANDAFLAALAVATAW